MTTTRHGGLVARHALFGKTLTRQEGQATRGRLVYFCDPIYEKLSPMTQIASASRG